MKFDSEFGQHWRDEDLLDRLYGLEPQHGTETHLENCPQCAARWSALEVRRAEFSAQPMLAEDLLRAQRHAIWNRIEDHGRVHWMRWALPSGAALTLALTALLYQPAPPLKPETPAEIAELNAAQPVSDSEFFDNVITVAAQSEPQAAQTVQGLFVAGGD